MTFIMIWTIIILYNYSTYTLPVHYIIFSKSRIITKTHSYTIVFFLYIDEQNYVLDLKRLGLWDDINRVRSVLVNPLESELGFISLHLGSELGMTNMDKLFKGKTYISVLNTIQVF